jgi:hypothetical protein
MSFSIKDLWNQLVNRTAQQEGVSVKHDMLVRNRIFKQQYKTWLETNRHTELLKNLYTSFTLSKLGITGELPILYYTERQSKHVLIHYIDPIGKHALPFLQDYFRDRVMRIGYTLFLSDSQLINRMGYTERIDSHLLKPQIKAFPFDAKHEQLYGAIQISFHSINSRPLYLRITSEELTDREFNKAYSFDELAEILFL